MLIGHKYLVEDFKALVKADKLAQSYIFFGEPEIGKFYFAKHLANLLENGEFNISGRPLQDALILEDSSGIDAMREIKNFLWQKPNISLKRLVVINDAQNLTSQAQNAILKITEEPPESSVIILIANHFENLLPALLSRLQKIYFSRLSNSEMETVTSDKKIIDLSFGRPGRAMRLVLKDPLLKEAEIYANQFLKAEGSNRSRLIKELVEAQKENPWLLDLFFESLMLKLRKDSVKNLDILKSVLYRLFLIKSYNVNKRLQLEALQ